MPGLILQFVLLSLLIVVAGIFLASSADRIAKLSGYGGTLVGFFLLAGATSLPELVIGCNAAFLEAADLAFGDMLGSSIFNLLILGVIDLTHRSKVRIVSSISAAHALSATASIALTGLILIGLMIPNSFEIMRVDVTLWVVAIAYILSVRLIYFDQRLTQIAESEPSAEQESGGMSLSRSLVQFVVAAILVFICGPELTRVADRLAEESGLGGTLIGTVFVAITTSLPEIITTLVAVRLGAFEMAAGNVFGSNCFNLAILPIVDFCYLPGSLLQAVEAAHTITASCIVLVSAVATMGLLYRAEKRYWVIEPDALAVVLLSIASLLAVVFLSGG